MNVTLQTMTLGGAVTKKIHLKMYAADQVHNPSTALDTTSTLVGSVLSGNGVATFAVDPNDNRAIILTAVAPGTTTIHFDKVPASPGGSVNCTLTVSPAFVDNSRTDFLSEDPAV